ARRRYGCGCCAWRCLASEDRHECTSAIATGLRRSGTPSPAQAPRSGLARPASQALRRGCAPLAAPRFEPVAMSLPAPLPYAPQLLESHSRAIAEAPRKELVRADRLTGKLKRKYGSRITGHSVQPAREGRYAELPADLPAPIA